MSLCTWQGWRGWKQDEEGIPWVPCTTIACLEKRKRPIGFYDLIWFILCIGSYAFVSLMGYYYYHEACTQEKNSDTDVCKSNLKSIIYKLISRIGGGLFLAILAATRATIPRFKCVGDRWVTSYLVIWGGLVELGIVAIVGGFLHAHVQMFSWLFIAFALLDMCVMNLIVPTYDFKGPTIFAQIAVASSLISGVRAWSFTPWVIVSCFGVFHLKHILDFNWREKLPSAWVEFLTAHGIIIN